MADSGGAGTMVTALLGLVSLLVYLMPAAIASAAAEALNEGIRRLRLGRGL